ncbi:hypothetical protein [Parachlamydia sp. AcF125]|uniref:hypothetical protein n=1 Tax=Parachlamydia sp. AcF125 TaxID=2795736 RepID=UPI001BC9AF3E|nr:hypothetical protein [Parachlamydia sp. AcF125]MBS4169089.1 hypothetical protein [Parachlamydia sp. AcF125]
MAQENIIFIEVKLLTLVKPQQQKQACSKMEAKHPGYLLARDNAFLNVPIAEFLRSLYGIKKLETKLKSLYKTKILISLVGKGI